MNKHNENLSMFDDIEHRTPVKPATKTKQKELCNSASNHNKHHSIYQEHYTVEEILEMTK